MVIPSEDAKLSKSNPVPNPVDLPYKTYDLFASGATTARSSMPSPLKSPIPAMDWPTLLQLFGLLIVNPVSGSVGGRLMLAGNGGVLA